MASSLILIIPTTACCHCVSLVMSITRKNFNYSFFGIIGLAIIGVAVFLSIYSIQFKIAVEFFSSLSILLGILAFVRKENIWISGSCTLLGIAFLIYGNYLSIALWLLLSQLVLLLMLIFGGPGG